MRLVDHIQNRILSVKILYQRSHFLRTKLKLIHLTRTFFTLVNIQNFLYPSPKFSASFNLPLSPLHSAYLKQTKTRIQGFSHLNNFYDSPQCDWFCFVSGYLPMLKIAFITSFLVNSSSFQSHLSLHLIQKAFPIFTSLTRFGRHPFMEL